MNGEGRLIAAIAALPGVGLGELEARAALLTRRDRKYLVPVDDAMRLVSALPPQSHALTIDGRHAFRYQSVYFDTPDRRSYLAAAHRRPRRFKVRTRSYLDAGRSVLEVKLRDGRGQTHKERLDREDRDALALDASALDFVRMHDLIGTTADALAPALTTSYRRSTILVPGGSRLTIDVALAAWTPAGRAAELPGIAVIETKSPGPPTIADRALWALGYRPVRISKFCTSLAAIDPTLPANRWTRALRRPWVTLPVTALRLAG